MAIAPTLLILADDLTGAADCAVRWRITGWPATVQLHPHPNRHAGATAWISDSRHLAPQQAAERVRTLLSQGSTDHVHHWYKKIDSTLRGNLGAELDATLATLGRAHAVICPAFPAQRRGLHHGLLACDAIVAAPVSLPDRLAEQSQRPVATIELECVRAGPRGLADQMRGLADQASLIVCDGLSDADLNTIAQATLLALPDAVLCGSAGLFSGLAARYPHAPVQQEPALACQRVLVVMGSGSTIAHQQLRVLQQRYQVARIQNELTAPASAAIALLHQPLPAANAILDGPHARQLAEQLADQACQWIDRAEPDLLIVVGGDTAMALFERLAISELLIERELLPGIPLSQAVAASGRQYQLILKAGNFGDPTTLADLLDRCADLQSARRN